MMQKPTVTRDIALTITIKGDAADALPHTAYLDLIYGGLREAVVTALEALAGYAPYTGTFTVLYNSSTPDRRVAPIRSHFRQRRRLLPSELTALRG